MVSENTGLPKSNVLQFDLGNGESVVIRPSGTEPNLKIYLALTGGTKEMKEYFDGRIGSNC